MTILTSGTLIEHTNFPRPYLLEATILGINETEKNSLTYHNKEHLSTMFNSIKTTWFPQTAVPVEYTLCVAWHDAVYIPGAPEGYNEKLSSIIFKKKAAYLRKLLSSDIDDLPQIELASRAIERTAMKYHLGDLAHLGHNSTQEYTFFARMLDADLSSMASTPEYFEVNQARILAEHEVALLDVMQGNIEGYIKNLISFYTNLKTCRDTIYRTPEALVKYEIKAQKNISTLLKRAQNNPQELCDKLVSIYHAFKPAERSNPILTKI